MCAFSDYERYNFIGWDGDKGKPIDIRTVNSARRFRSLMPHHMPVPDIAPGPDGTIGFEWRQGAPSLETIILAKIGPQDTIKVLRVNADNISKVWPSLPDLGAAVKLLESLLFLADAR